MESITIGMDLGDKKNVVCVLDNLGRIIESPILTSLLMEEMRAKYSMGHHYLSAPVGSTHMNLFL